MEWLALFIVFSIVFVVDTFILNKNSAEISIKKVLTQSAVYTLLAALFGIVVWFARGTEQLSAYYASYVTELSLSVDNLFVFSLIFTKWCVTIPDQRRMLSYGIVGAAVLRGIFIGVGAAVLTQWEWLLYIMGLILLATAAKMLFTNDEPEIPKFAVWLSERMKLSPFWICVLVIEVSDVIFAIDSVPTSLGITHDSFVVFAANMFAIMGLRSLYFLLLNMIDRFEYLKNGVAIVLIFIAVKILISHFITIPIFVALIVTFAILGVSVKISLDKTAKVKEV